MNLLMYFCIPLVVTGQIVQSGSQSYIQPSDENESTEDAESSGTSNSGLYSKHAYGSQVGYTHSDLDDFVVAQDGLYYRRPAVNEDSGEIGKPSIYNTNANSGNDDHPSFITSNIYNSIKDKKNKDNGHGHSSNQMPSPLSYGAPLAQDQQSAIVIDSNDPNLQPVSGHVSQHLSPVVHQVPVAPQHVLLRDPKTGELVQSPLYPNGLIPVHPSHVAPQVSYYHASGGSGQVLTQELPVAQKVHPSLKTVPLLYQQYAPVQHNVLTQTAHAPIYQQTHLLKTGVTPSYLQKVSGEQVYGSPVLKTEPASYYHHPQLLKTGAAPLYHQAPLLETGAAPGYPYLQKTVGDHGHGAPLLKDHVTQHYHPQLLKTVSTPVHQTPLLKTADGLVYQEPALKTTVPVHPTPLIKSGHPTVPLYYHHPSLLRAADGTLYQQPLLKPNTVPLLLKSPDGKLYQSPYYNPLLLKTPTGEVYQNPGAAPLVYSDPHKQILLKDTVFPLYQSPPVLNDAAAHALLKENNVPTYHEHLLKTKVPVLQQQHVLKSVQSPLLETQLLKTPNVDATIVPAIEEHVHGISHAAAYVPAFNPVHGAHSHYAKPGTTYVTPNHPKIVVQKAVLQKSPVLTEKAVLKATLSPVYTNPAIDTNNAIFKAPLVTHFIQNGHLERDLPARILTSQRALVNSLISTDAGKIRGGKAATLLAGASSIELVPSLSYGYSYSLYPKSNGGYGPPQHGHRHQK